MLIERNLCRFQKPLISARETEISLRQASTRMPQDAKYIPMVLFKCLSAHLLQRRDCFDSRSFKNRSTCSAATLLGAKEEICYLNRRLYTPTLLRKGKFFVPPLDHLAPLLDEPWHCPDPCNFSSSSLSRGNRQKNPRRTHLIQALRFASVRSDNCDVGNLFRPLPRLLGDHWVILDNRMAFWGILLDMGCRIARSQIQFQARRQRAQCINASLHVGPFPFHHDLEFSIL